MPTPESVREALAPVARFVSTLDLAHPEAAQSALDAEFPPSSLEALRSLLYAAHDAGWLTPKQANDTLCFGRIAKPSPEMSNHSVDVVDMSGAGAPHTHPNGEVSLCFATDGAPAFCGNPPGWVVVPPGSRHVPTVTGGRMLIVYFLPEGAMDWG